MWKAVISSDYVTYHNLRKSICNCLKKQVRNIYVFFLNFQSASEKHKINVPETMNEFLDMSDDEGM